MKRPTQIDIDAYECAKMLAATYPQRGSMYIIGDMGGVLRTLADLAAGGYGGEVTWWRIKDRKHHGLPAICGFVRLYPAGGGGGWTVREQSEPAAKPRHSHAKATHSRTRR